MERGGLNINIPLSMSHFILTVLSAWSLKNVKDKSTLSLLLFLTSCLYGMYGLLQYTLPRKFDSCFNLSVCLIIQLLTLFLYTFDVLLIAELYKNIILIITIALVVISAMLIIFAYYLNTGSKMTELLLSTFYFLFAWIICILAYVIINYNECYWIIGTICLLILNYVILMKLTSFYNITFLEFFSISFCFFIYFAISSINEISVIN